MAWIFSKRCKQSLSAGTITVTIPKPVRIRIWKTLEKHNNMYYINSQEGFGYQTSTLEELPEIIKTELGREELLAFPENDEGPAIASDLKGFVLRGNYPPNVFDILELYYFNNSPNQISFQRDINQILDESNLPWRIAEGKVFPVNSKYIDENILQKSQELLNEVKFDGALKEFEKARTDIVNSDFLGAIQNANLAIESVIKGILKIDKAKPGEMFRKLIDSKLIPEYYDGFLKAFEEYILRSVAIMRNEEKGAGHGQGPITNEVPKELAELGVHLSGVLIHYLIKKYISSPMSAPNDQEAPDDLPF